MIGKLIYLQKIENRKKIYRKVQLTTVCVFTCCGIFAKQLVSFTIDCKLIFSNKKMSKRMGRAGN